MRVKHLVHIIQGNNFKLFHDLVAQYGMKCYNYPEYVKFLIQARPFLKLNQLNLELSTIVEEYL